MHPVSIVIPTLNEAEAIGAAIREIPPAYTRGTSSSPTAARPTGRGTRPAAGARVIEAGRGYGRACALGAAAADPASRVIVYLDGDGADRGDLIDRIARPVLAGHHDLVLASRTLGSREPGAMLWHQVLAGRLAGLGIGLRYGVRYTDMCAFRAIDRTALQALDLRELTYGWNIEMQMQAARVGLRIREVPMPSTGAVWADPRRWRVRSADAAGRHADRRDLPARRRVGTERVRSAMALKDDAAPGLWAGTRMEAPALDMLEDRGTAPSRSFALAVYLERWSTCAHHALAASDSEPVPLAALLRLAGPEDRLRWRKADLGYADPRGASWLRATVAARYHRLDADDVFVSAGRRKRWPAC